MPKWALYIAVAVSTLCSLFITACLFTTLSVRDRILIVIVVIFIFAYSFYRLKAGKVDLHEIEAAKAAIENIREQQIIAERTKERRLKLTVSVFGNEQEIKQFTEMMDANGWTWARESLFEIKAAPGVTE